MTIYTDSEAVVNGFKSRVTNFIEGRKIGSSIPKSDKQRWKLLRQYATTKTIMITHARDSDQMHFHEVAHTASVIARQHHINFVEKSAQATRKKFSVNKEA